jgi:hypothetical protein
VVRRRAILVVLLATAVGILAAVSSPARIEPGRGIAGVKLDMSAKSVREALGPPGSRYERDTPWGRAFVYRYPRLRLRVTFAAANNRVVRITTRSASEKTRRGLGVGSSEKRVRRVLRRERCDRPVRPSYCFTGGSSSAHTVYYFGRRRVSAVTVVLTIGVE